MKKVIFIFLLGIGVLYGAESSCQISLYYANGVLQDKNEKKAQRLWEIEVEKLQKQYPKLTSSTLLAKTSYNSSFLWGLDDFLEAFLQWSIGQAVTLARMLEFENEYALKLLKQVDSLGQIFDFNEINKHINAYNSDLKAGGGVVVVAHSQGNFFTNKAYEYLDQCNRERFKMISVASPAASVAGDGPRISWDNDIVPWVSLAPWTVKNPNRKRARNAIGEIIELHSIAYHGFNYYIGGSVEEKDMGKTITASTNKSRIQIVDQIVNAVNQINKIGCVSQNLPNLTHSGAIEVTLSWTCANNVDLNLYLTGNSVEQDIKDVENLGLEHAYVASQSSIHPGDTFVASSTGKKRPQSSLEESYLEDNPINIYAVVKTLGGSKFKQYEAQNFGQLTLGEFAAIEVKDKKFETTYSSGGGGSYATPVYTPPYVRTYNECDEKDKKYTCQCVPCEYIIHGMKIRGQVMPMLL